MDRPMAEPIGCGDQYTVTLLVYPEELESRANLNHTEFPVTQMLDSQLH